jgi:LmbE family N-acetylglucosaminyl deacetylase
MVTAHPDDETLWAGGLLARFRRLPWLVYCCSTPRRDPERRERFFDACRVFGVPSFGNLQVEGEPGQPIPWLSDWLSFLGKNSHFTTVVTHGAHGEYGHSQHVDVHRAVLDAFPGRVLGFGWHRGGRGELELKLTAADTALKRAALDCYGAKAEALRNRYYGELGVPEGQESYDIYRE